MWLSADAPPRCFQALCSDAAASSDPTEAPGASFAEAPPAFQHCAVMSAQEPSSSSSSSSSSAAATAGDGDGVWSMDWVGWSPTVEALNSRLKQSARNATSSSRSALYGAGGYQQQQQQQQQQPGAMMMLGSDSKGGGGALQSANSMTAPSLRGAWVVALRGATSNGSNTNASPEDEYAQAKKLASSSLSSLENVDSDAAAAASDGRAEVVLWHVPPFRLPTLHPANVFGGAASSKTQQQQQQQQQQGQPLPMLASGAG